MIIQNQVRCNICKDEPFSSHRHDYKSCKCGNIAVDGGMEYLRRVGGNYTELSFSIPDNIVEEVKEAIKWGHDTKRNELGIACAVFRVLKKNNILVTGE